MADAHPKAGASHKRVGSLVRGKYRVEAFLATGTMANVYAATHRNGAKVALKILHAQLAEDPSLCERFKREGYFANSIGHPGIVRAIDDDVTEDGCPFMVMELLEGETLEERRRRKGGRLPLSWVLPVADALLDILAAAHAREVLHRDLKPDNVFVTRDGDVKILDFGVARWNDGKSSSDMTAMGMVLGTPAFMPPEQALGRREEVDAQSDLWAIGATLFVVLSGEPVHVGGDAKAKLIATARTAARPLRDAAPEIPRAVAAVIDRALAFHKAERWADAGAMREALRWARMAVDGRSSDTLASSNEHTLEAIPPPVPTQRTFEDETLARAISPEEPAPRAFDVGSSAPPITTRDVPRSEPPSTARFFPPPPVPPLAESALAKSTTLAMSQAPPMTARSTAPLAMPLGAVVEAAAYARPASQTSMRPSLTPEAPGPMLAQVVEPRRGPLRVAVALALGLLFAVVTFVVMRSRAASAGADPDASSMQAASNRVPPVSAPVGAPAATTTSVADLPSAATAHAGAAAGPAAVKKARPHRPHKPAAGPAVAAAASSAAPPASAATEIAAPPPEPTAAPAPEPTAAPAPEPTAPEPLDTTPRDSLPSKEPDPP